MISGVRGTPVGTPHGDHANATKIRSAVVRMPPPSQPIPWSSDPPASRSTGQPVNRWSGQLANRSSGRVAGWGARRSDRRLRRRISVRSRHFEHVLNYEAS
jgi:hypothetical protein